MLRLVAAATARFSNSGKPARSSISTSSAACVVPFGLVTFTRNCAGSSYAASASAPAPATVAFASCIASPSGKPCATPAAAIVSIRWNT